MSCLTESLHQVTYENLCHEKLPSLEIYLNKLPLLYQLTLINLFPRASNTHVAVSFKFLLNQITPLQESLKYLISTKFKEGRMCKKDDACM